MLIVAQIQIYSIQIVLFNEKEKKKSILTMAVKASTYKRKTGEKKKKSLYVFELFKMQHFLGHELVMN